MTATAPPKRIVILGGGTAGWMAANLIAKRWGGERVTLVESPEIGIIGVGEGSTPQLKQFFDMMDIAESTWMPRCNATYKNGIRFNGWSARAGYESYFHPFPTALDDRTEPVFAYNARARRTGRNVDAHPDRFFIPTYLAAHHLAPIAPDHFPFRIGYGYHFDAHLVGAFLRDHALSLGVTHLERKIEGVQIGQDGAVSHLVSEGGDQIEGEFFIDSSGFRSAIVQDALGEPFVSFADNLFNDSAVVMPTPANPTTTNAQTNATALSSGWAWDIPLTNRSGNGYVYASSFITDDAAETELRAHLGLLDSATQARHLKMKVGRVQRTWVKNALAVGLSQGFIEPLEATALHLVQTTVEQFLDAWDAQDRDGFNGEIAARFEGVRDYIVCHYRMNQRADSDYWQANAANTHLSDSLKRIMTCWFSGGDLTAEIAEQNIARFYAPMSWHCLLAGYGTFPDDTKIKPPGDDIEKFDLTQIDDFVRRCALNFEDHRAVLERMAA
jgi:glycine/D-amino acid oxidase-like deaminating enzyme